MRCPPQVGTCATNSNCTCAFPSGQFVVWTVTAASGCAVPPGTGVIIQSARTEKFCRAALVTATEGSTAGQQQYQVYCDVPMARALDDGTRWTSTGNGLSWKELPLTSPDDGASPTYVGGEGSFGGFESGG